MPRLRPPKVSVDKPDPSESISKLFESKEEDAPEELFENKPEITEPSESTETKVVEEKKPEVVEPPKEDESALALKKQAEALAQAEEYQKKLQQAQFERDQALKRAQERETEVLKYQKEATQSQYDSINTALSAAQAEAESAKRDIKAAITEGNADLQADAYERLATARANISKLEDGKFELEARLKTEPTPEVKPEPKPQVQVDPIDTWGLPEITTKYLKANRSWLTNDRMATKLKTYSYEAEDAGLTPHTQEFIDYVDKKMRQPKEQPQQQERTIVSAPVSREVPSGGTVTRQNGKITLSPEEKEMAKISGITEVEYARQKQKLQEAKANGQYTGGQ